jgi:hypothetical protein
VEGRREIGRTGDGRRTGVKKGRRKGGVDVEETTQ